MSLFLNYRHYVFTHFIKLVDLWIIYFISVEHLRPQAKKNYGNFPKSPYIHDKIDALIYH